MSHHNSAVTLLRSQYGAAHNVWLEGTMKGVTAEQAHWAPPGRALPIAAHYAHVVIGEDVLLASMVRKVTPLAMGAFAGKAGVSEPPPMGPWDEWGRRVQVDLDALRQYAQAVYAGTDEYLATLSDADLSQEIDLSAVGFGMQPLGNFLSIMCMNVIAHTGEISVIKGLQGLQGYPF